MPHLRINVQHQARNELDARARLHRTRGDQLRKNAPHSDQNRNAYADRVRHEYFVAFGE